MQRVSPGPSRDLIYSWQGRCFALHRSDVLFTWKIKERQENLKALRRDLNLVERAPDISPDEKLRHRLELKQGIKSLRDVPMRSRRSSSLAVPLKFSLAFGAVIERVQKSGDHQYSVREVKDFLNLGGWVSRFDCDFSLGQAKRFKKGMEDNFSSLVYRRWPSMNRFSRGREEYFSVAVGKLKYDLFRRTERQERSAGYGWNLDVARTLGAYMLDCPWRVFEEIKSYGLSPWRPVTVTELVERFLKF